MEDIITYFRKRNRAPHPSTCLSGLGSNFITVVMRLNDYETQTTSFVRLPIPMKVLDEILDKIQYDSRIRYVRHKHGDCLKRNPSSLDCDWNGPFNTDLPYFKTVTAAIDSVVYYLNDQKSVFLYCDFSQSHPKWQEGKSFPSSFRFAKHYGAMTLDGKLYVTGFHDYWDKLCCKIFNLSEGFWDSLGDLTLPIVIKHSDLSSVIMVSTAQKILVLDLKNHCQREYDPQLLQWKSTDSKGLRLANNYKGHEGNPINVEEEKTIYWLDNRGCIKAFDWGCSKFYMGPIISLAHEKDCWVSFMSPLLHLKKQLFCVVWVDEHSTCHCTIVRVSRDTSRESLDIVHRLFAVVVDCFPYNLGPSTLIDLAYKLV